MLIRRARADDAEAHFDLHGRAWPTAYGAYVDAARMDAVADGMPHGRPGARA